MQPVDFTTLAALCTEIEQNCLPARLEQVLQTNSTSLYLQLRTATVKLWLLLTWHPQAARLHLVNPPPRQPDTFTFSQQILHQVAGLALVSVKLVGDWERVVCLSFAQRPDDQVLWQLYLEVMGRRSNLILVNGEGIIVTAAHQVSDRQSRYRVVQTGDRYQLPPPSLSFAPSLDHDLEQWQGYLREGRIIDSLVKSFQGVSTSLAQQLLAAAKIQPHCLTKELSSSQWQDLFGAWQTWLDALKHNRFVPVIKGDRYQIVDFAKDASVLALQTNQILQSYYGDRLQAETFEQLRQQIMQTLSHQLQKLEQKVEQFNQKLAEARQAEQVKVTADLLIANLYQIKPGMTAIVLPAFDTGQPVTIALDPTHPPSQNAQDLYKKYQKLKRAITAIAPLLAAVAAEINYLEQVKLQVLDLNPADQECLEQVQTELIQQGYLRGVDRSPKTTSKKEPQPNYQRYLSPNGHQVWVGRNNFQNDLLTFRTANAYDLWFHAQEIPSAHVLLRLEPGQSPELEDLQFTANICAHHSRARHSEYVPIIYTQPKLVSKPKGAKPGMVIYRQEQVIWGNPSQAQKTALG
ncbi:MAG: NFACT RNA binding domain-containing protein [Pseudanabaenaceae cyanobacterium bins.68]|nr:NFACT RNA binding domain-containing protein [Pseudanabaenaceae cyanobacterium bins.68]